MEFDAIHRSYHPKIARYLGGATFLRMTGTGGSDDGTGEEETSAQAGQEAAPGRPDLRGTWPSVAGDVTGR